MIKLVIKLRNYAINESSKLNRNNKGYICSSFCLKNTFEEIDFCG